jgi:hypothetical protein
MTANERMALNVTAWRKTALRWRDERDAAIMALKDMLDGYAPDADKTVRHHGENALVSYVKRARQVIREYEKRYGVLWCAFDAQGRKTCGTKDITSKSSRVHGDDGKKQI